MRGWDARARDARARRESLSFLSGSSVGFQNDGVAFRVYDSDRLVELRRFCCAATRHASFSDVQALVDEIDARLNEPPVRLSRGDHLTGDAVKTVESVIGHLA